MIGEAWKPFNIIETEVVVIALPNMSVEGKLPTLLKMKTIQWQLDETPKDVTTWHPLAR